MQEFFRYIYAQDLNFVVLLTAIAVVIWAYLNATAKNKKVYLIINSAFCVLLLVAVLYRTLFSRSGTYTEIELIPFRFYFISDDKVAAVRTFFMNAVMFVPLGLSMPYVLSRKPRKWIIVFPIIFACLLSVGIEYCQYYYHLGRCETDDVIANTLGAAVGALSYLLYIRILKNRKESLMNSKISDNQNLLAKLCSKSMFGKEYDLPEDYNCDELGEESVRQTVFPQIFSYIKESASPNADKLFAQIIAKNIRVEYGHNEVHKALTNANIPYVVLKGVASASYYNEPMLRMMGDIDILVSPDNIVAADSVLKSIGFVTSDALESDHKHIAYKRRDGLICELHRNINGIPLTAKGELIEECFNDIFDKSIVYKTSNGSCIVPGKYHHGLILLLHTANHLTNEGVGLRHLCDWAVFVNGFSSDEFVLLFEKSLKETGLWRFAQLLTLCCVKYLGCDAKPWAGEASDELIDSMITDILNGGNFGMKDADRYSQIKYISDRKSGEKAKKSPIMQLLSSINEKTKNEFEFANKSKILLPIGWICTVSKYLYMVVMGKRRLDGIKTIKGAQQRKELYEEFELFK